MQVESLDERGLRGLVMELLAAVTNSCPEFRMIALSGLAAELAAALDRPWPVAYRIEPRHEAGMS